MIPFDSEEFLNRRYYATDIVIVVSDVSDFLEFAERNIDWQYKSETQVLRRRAASGELSQDYYEHLLENTTHRFTVSLPMRVRYSALVALITAIDWSAKFLKVNARFRLPSTPARTNSGLHILRCFNKKTSLGRDATLNDYASLVTIRNAVVHDAGIKEGRSGNSSLIAAVEALQGFDFEKIPWLGECVSIRRGALEPCISEMAELIPAVYQAADEQGLLA